MQAWEKAEKARHRDVLSQLKREIVAIRPHTKPSASLPSPATPTEFTTVSSRPRTETKKRVQPLLKNVAIL